MPTDNQLYVSVETVKRRLNTVRDEYDDEYIKEIIIEAMNFADSISGTTWNGRRKIAEEVHSLREVGYIGGVIFGQGYKFYLLHSDITDIKSIQYPYAQANPKTLVSSIAEAHADTQIVLDVIEGTIGMKYFFFDRGGKEIYIKYEYGRDELDEDVKYLTLWQTLKLIHIGDRFRVELPDGGDSVRDDALKTYDEQITKYSQKLLPLKTIVTGRELGEVQEAP